MVSNASEDLPEPDRPVNTTSWSRGMATSTFLRLCSRAPRMAMVRASRAGWRGRSGIRLERSKNGSVLPVRGAAFPRVLSRSRHGGNRPSYCIVRRAGRPFIMRLDKKIAIVIGAGQGPGTGMGNGRATVIRFVQEGATVLAVDRDLASAQETCAMAKDAKGKCEAFEADVTSEASMKAMIAQARKKWGRIDILHYNVGLSLAGGDA